MKKSEPNSQEKANDGWGEWEEQDPTQDSEIWVEEQRKRKNEVAKVVEARQIEEKPLVGHTASLHEQYFELKQPDDKEQAPADIVQQLRVVPEVFEETAEADNRLSQLAQAVNELLEMHEGQVNRRKANHLFFASHESTPIARVEIDETKNDLSPLKLR